MNVKITCICGKKTKFDDGRKVNCSKCGALLKMDGVTPIVRIPESSLKERKENVPWTAVGRYAVLLALMIFVGMGIVALVIAWVIAGAIMPPVTAVMPQPAQDQQAAQVVYIVATPTDAPPASPPTRIIMPEIGLDAAIEPAAITQTPAYNVGWWPDSAQRGDVVLFGHNYAALAPLARVQPGQQMTLASVGGALAYTVTRLETRPADGNVPEPVAGQVVLITCLPFPNGSAERLIVYAQEVAR